MWSRGLSEGNRRGVECQPSECLSGRRETGGGVQAGLSR